MMKFLRWIKNLFKEKPKPYVKSAEENQFDEIKKKYRLERYPITETTNPYYLYYLQYYQNTQWFYLRKWNTGDFSLERTKDESIRIGDPKFADQHIKEHNKWISGGRIFISFD